MASNPLSAQSLLKCMADALPQQSEDDTTSAISSSSEAVALFTHACMIAVGFRLIGLDEDNHDETEFQRIAPHLPPKWNASVNSYSFFYAHSQSAMRFVIKIDRLGGKAEIRGLAVGDERIARFEITSRDYVSASALPLRSTDLQSRDSATNTNDSDVTSTSTSSPSQLTQKLQTIFMSPERIADLAALIRTNILQKLIPGLSKAGYQETRNEDDRIAEDDARRPPRQQQPPNTNPMPQPARPYPFDNDPLAAPRPARPLPTGEFLPPDFEDEHQMNGPVGRPYFGGGGGRHPLGIGHDDLYPPGMGPNDPFGAPSFGMVPNPRGGGSGGMYPSLEDPLFGGRRGGGSGGGGQGGAPPGARWDPVGPGGPRFPGQGGGPFGFNGDII